MMDDGNDDDGDGDGVISAMEWYTCVPHLGLK